MANAFSGDVIHADVVVMGMVRHVGVSGQFNLHGCYGPGAPVANV